MTLTACYFTFSSFYDPQTPRQTRLCGRQAGFVAPRGPHYLFSHVMNPVTPHTPSPGGAEGRTDSFISTIHIREPPWRMHQRGVLCNSSAFICITHFHTIFPRWVPPLLRTPGIHIHFSFLRISTHTHFCDITCTHTLNPANPLRNT